jgi:RNA polymerase sigma-70 factor (ECF subfamily)
MGNMQQVSDADLMMLVREGDYVAFDQLYDRYRGPILRFLFSLTWDADIAEDYLQEVFLRLYRARDRYEPTGKFSTYIFQIAKNYYLAQRRKTKANAVELSLTFENRNGYRPFENLRVNQRIEPEVHLLEEYRKLGIRRAIAALPEHQKLVFVMSHLEDMKYAEIAEVLGIAVGTVKSRMFAAVNTLRTMLKEERQ